ncbi:FMN-linked oxidoreductase [Terfezia boudieri ATCC MYA-4762]|uniref:FMN-linked oxidoreductase n=1 Tax=Terfezia boudieri ATCC MYA-4762 TaxID=1051890 RepID=A0A3N4LQV9_9PEZI|nr:FMN-linked oxidoreductase [Terfezia boudieri ATCC MYA-4762]
MARLAHLDGEAGIARACGKNGILQMVSNNASMSLEQIASARASPSQNQWFQLYVQTVWEKSNKILQRVTEAGYTAIVLTLDAPTPGKREADERVKNFGNKTSAISGEGVANPSVNTGEGLGRALFAGTSPNLTWADLDNHGGRVMDTASPPIIPLWKSGNIARRYLTRLRYTLMEESSEALPFSRRYALGRRLGIGRAALFGLAGYGEEGVGRVIQILREEIEETCMRLLGVNSVKDLGLKQVMLLKTPSYETNVTRFVEGVKAKL